jgi:glycosyltransferase involved in cell wall biosynthesis
MRIVLDLQGGQNESRFRGIGRYTMSLARQMVLTGGDRHQIHVLLNSALPEGLPDVVAAFDGLLPRSHLHVVELPKPTSEMESANSWRTRAAELLREAALHELKPDLVHVASLFEGFSDNCVSSIGELGPSLPTAVTLYDMIPLLQPDIYLGNLQARRWYYRKAQFARRADLLLAISASSAAEGCAALHLPASRVLTIGTGIDDKFRPVQMAPADAAQLRRRYRLEKPFVMYAGAADPRKNLHGLMEAFARLPAPVRGQHSLAIVGKLKTDDLIRIRSQAATAGLAADEVVFVGFIPDPELIGLYSLCAALVFPSFHEGFGLPAAEAMACGAAVIGSDRTSIPEVIGRPDALFDPADPASIAERLARVLTDPAFRDELRRHGPIQASRFNWIDVAERGLAAFERLHRERRPTGAAVPGARLMPRVAFVSSLSSGLNRIAGYATRLLPELATVFDVTSIAVQSGVAETWLNAAVPIRSHEWLREHAGHFDHILYELADDTVTPALLEMMRSHPGGALLHDATLSAVLGRMSQADAAWLLYTAHGWHAALLASREGVPAAMRRFDCLLPFLAETEVVVVHSWALARHVGDRMHGGGPEVVHVPPPPALHPPPDRADARTRLGLSPDGFVVCSLVLGDAAVQRQVLDGWRSMAGTRDADALLFACGRGASDVTTAVIDDIVRFGTDRIHPVHGIEATRDALAASDLVLQLGDLSGADTAMLLPDLRHVGASVLTSDARPWSGLPAEAVACLPPEPDAAVIAEALDRRADPARGIGTASPHAGEEAWPAPGAMAEKVRAALAGVMAREARGAARALLRKLPELQEPCTPKDLAMAEALAHANRRPAGPPCLFIDVSVLSIRDARSGIQRVCRSIMAELVTTPPPGYRAEPIRWIDGDYVYARQYVHGLFGLPGAAPPDEPVYAADGDVYLGLDLIMDTISAARPWFEAQRLRGMRTVFVLYDLLPARRPDMFPPLIAPIYRNWIANVTELADGVIGISQAVMHELTDWLREHPPRRPLRLGWFHLGGDFEASLPSIGKSADAHRISLAFRQRETFLSVGTLEPRKGYRQALVAFEALWTSGMDVNYVIIGGRGWLEDTFFQQLEAHPEFGRRLFWFHGVSDEMLGEIYRQATAFLAVSEAEGFGLPLVEAAKFGLPIIARDIPVFREVTAGHASFFDTLSGAELGTYLMGWLPRHAAYEVPGSAMMPSYTWRASAQRLTEVAIHGQWSMSWQPNEAVAKSHDLSLV